MWNLGRGGRSSWMLIAVALRCVGIESGVYSANGEKKAKGVLLV
jgi:hypothetical protein